MYKKLVFPVGVVVVFGALCLSVPVGLAFMVGLVIGSLLEKSGLNK